MLTFNKITRKDTKHTLYMSVLTLMLAMSMALAGCSGDTGPEGPQGPKGSQGEQGAAGEVGPAGDDGSVMLAGKGKPGGKKGSAGDFYLNKNNGDLYGPKKESGWDSPISLQGVKGVKGDQGPKGDKGDKGDDGVQGPKGDKGDAGEDGSKIFKDNGSPDASDGSAGDYWLDTDNLVLYGPKDASSGWGGTSTSLKTRVTYYYFTQSSGYNFISQPTGISTLIFTLDDPGLNYKNDMAKSIWYAYLVKEVSGTDRYFSVPGRGYNAQSSYRTVFQWDDNDEEVDFRVQKVSGQGNKYDAVYIFRVPANRWGNPPVINPTLPKVNPNSSGLLDNLDTNDFNAVVKRFGFK